MTFDRDTLLEAAKVCRNLAQISSMRIQQVILQEAEEEILSLAAQQEQNTAAGYLTVADFVNAQKPMPPDLQQSANEFCREQNAAPPWPGYRADYQVVKQRAEAAEAQVAAWGIDGGQGIAWRAVCNVLNDVSPGWLDGADSGMECAVRAIQALANSRLRAELEAAKRDNAKLLRDLAGYSDTEADGIVFCGKCGAKK